VSADGRYLHKRAGRERPFAVGPRDREATPTATYVTAESVIDALASDTVLAEVREAISPNARAHASAVLAAAAAVLRGRQIRRR
jgi:hypothetical protein